MFWLLRILLLTSGAWFLGWRLGRGGRGGRVRVAGVLGGVGLWFLSALFARYHADSAGWGWVPAEWWAHSGKWWVFLAGTQCLMACGLAEEFGQMRPARKAAAMLVGSLLLWLPAWRTFPVWWVLGDGVRDDRGYLRQRVEAEYTCGAVALGNYLERYSGWSGVTERDMARRCGTTVEGTTASGLLLAAREAGLTRARLILPDPEALGSLVPPAILSISTLPGLRHATLWVGQSGGMAHFIDPAYGDWQYSVDRLPGILKGRSLVPGETSPFPP